MYTIDQINDAIARKARVTARHSDLRRPGQPNPGSEIRITRAFELMYDGRVRVNADGYKGRFAASDLRITDLVLDTTPDTY